MPRKLSETRIRILRRLEARDISVECAETAREIAVACGEAHRATDWATGALREMASSYGPVKALVRRVTHGGTGSGAANAATWTITDAGREALALAEGRPASSGEGKCQS